MYEQEKSDIQILKSYLQTQIPATPLPPNDVLLSPNSVALKAAIAGLDKELGRLDHSFGRPFIFHNHCKYSAQITNERRNEKKAIVASAKYYPLGVARCARRTRSNATRRDNTHGRMEDVRHAMDDPSIRTPAPASAAAETATATANQQQQQQQRESPGCRRHERTENEKAWYDAARDDPLFRALVGRWDDNDEDDDVVISVPYHSVYTKTNTNGEDEEDGNEEEEGENATMKLRPLRMRFQLEKHLFDGEHVEIRRRTAPKGPPEERDACKEDLAAAARRLAAAFVRIVLPHLLAMDWKTMAVARGRWTSTASRYRNCSPRPSDPRCATSSETPPRRSRPRSTSSRRAARRAKKIDPWNFVMVDDSNSSTD